MKKTLVLAIALIVSTSTFAQVAAKRIAVRPGDTLIVDGIPTVVGNAPSAIKPPVKKYKRRIVSPPAPVAIPTIEPVRFYEPDSNKYAAQYYQRLLIEHDKSSNFVLWVALAGVMVALVLMALFVDFVLRNRHVVNESSTSPSPIHQSFHNYGGAGGVGHGGDSRNTINTGHKSGNVKDVDKRTENLILVPEEESEVVPAEK